MDVDDELVNGLAVLGGQHGQMQKFAEKCDQGFEHCFVSVGLF